MANGERNGIEGCTLALNYTTAGFTHIFFNILVIKGRENAVLSAYDAVIFGNRNIGNVSEGPRNERRIAMFTENISMNVLLIDAVIFGNSCTKSCCIKDSTGTDDLVFRDTGALAPNVSENVYRV